MQARAFASVRSVCRPCPSFFARQHRKSPARGYFAIYGFNLLETLGLTSSKKRGGMAAMAASMGCQLAPKEPPPGKELATFAGGCFWGLELKFQREPGVEQTSSGYTQGHLENPSYEQVCSGRTGHTEAVQVVYDPKQTTYRRLLEAFAEQTDMTTPNRQGGDRGTQYRSGVYYHNEEQKAEAEKFMRELEEELNSGTSKRGWAMGEVVSELKPAGDYYLAEGYHQQYLSKGGRFGTGQSAEKGCKDTIRCYG